MYNFIYRGENPAMDWECIKDNQYKSQDYTSRHACIKDYLHHIIKTHDEEDPEFYYNNELMTNSHRLYRAHLIECDCGDWCCDCPC